MTDLFDPARARADHATAAARLLVPAITDNAKITRAILNDAMVAAYGGADADGHWTQRDSFEVLEHATALAVRRTGAVITIDTATAILARLPTQTVRSEEQVDWQQFSTPLDLASVAVTLACATDDDVVVEPSAGNGLLVAGLPTVAALQLNEIDHARRARLAATFPGATISGHDGAQIATVMAATTRPTLYVIDKVADDTTTVTVQRRDVRELADALAVPPRSALITEKAPVPVKRGGAISLLRSVRSKPATAPRLFRAPTRNEVLPVGYQVLETPAPLDEQTGVYLPYRPSRIVFDAAGEHPTALVESIAMGSIPAPIPAHIPSLPERTVTERLLSSSQLETVVYAGHAWTQFIPGISKPDKEGVGLVLAEDGRAYRKGYFLGDGTGAGKGRQVAAVKVGCVFRRVTGVDALGFARHEGEPIHGLVDADRYERRRMPETFGSLGAVRVESTAPITKQVSASELAGLSS